MRDRLARGGTFLICIIAVLMIASMLCVNALAAVGSQFDRLAGISMAEFGEPSLTKSVGISNISPNIQITRASQMFWRIGCSSKWHFGAWGQYNIHWRKQL